MYTDNNIPSKPSMTLSALQQIQDLTGKLEIAHQEIINIRLEKMEFEKEINQLKQQNEELKEENNLHFESARMDSQRLSVLRKVSSNIDDINLYNDNLNIQIFEQRNLIKQLKSQNITLQKENEKYKIILEQLNEEKQKRDEMQRSDSLNSQNKIKELEDERDRLREEVFSLQISPDFEPTPTSPPTYPIAKYMQSNDEIFRVRTQSMSFNQLPLLSELGGRRRSSKYSVIRFETAESMTNNYDNYMQLFEENEHLPMDIATTTMDLPMTTMGNKQEIKCIDCKCEQYEIEIQAKMAEIDILKSINNNSKSIIKTLQKQMRMLRKKNQELRLEKKKKKENENKCENIFNLHGCFSK